MITTRKTNPNRPFRIMVYGTEGVGKSSFGAGADRPVFICPEGGADQLSTDELQINGSSIHTFDQVVLGVDLLTREDHDFKTLVIDSADWVERLCHAKIVGNTGRSIITANGGYGSGYRESERLHRELIEKLSTLRDKKGMNILITAHAHVRTVKDPEMMQEYDGFEPKMHEMVSSLYREWVDGLFFVRFRTFVKQSDETSRARALGDGSRVLYTEKRPAFQAKNRYGMPPEIDFTLDAWKEVMKYVSRSPAGPADAGNEGEIDSAALQEDIARLSALVDAKTKAAVDAAVSKPGANLKAIYDRLVVITNKE